MAKLKFDRIVRIVTKTQEKIIVPDDEVWKGTLGWRDNLCLNEIEIADGSQNNRVAPNVILGGAAIIYSKCIFTGVAFKVIS